MERGIGYQLRRAYFGIHRKLRAKIAHLDLSVDQYVVLMLLNESDGLTQKEIWSDLPSDANTVAAILKRMEAKGWIERKTCNKDRRAIRVYLNQSGQTLYNEAASLAIEIRAQAVSGLNAEELKNLMHHLTVVGDNLAY